MEVSQEFTEVPGRYTNVVRVPRVLWHGRTELKEVSATDMNVVQNRTWVPVRIAPGKMPRAGFCTYPTKHNLGVLSCTEELLYLFFCCRTVRKPFSPNTPAYRTSRAFCVFLPAAAERGLGLFRFAVLRFVWFGVLFSIWFFMKA